ncbi:MAG: hypothetical protein ACFE94_19470 [Candidatus Hodarchaeota archaeon]
MKKCEYFNCNNKATRTIKQGSYKIYVCSRHYKRDTRKGSDEALHKVLRFDTISTIICSVCTIIITVIILLLAVG